MIAIGLLGLGASGCAHSRDVPPAFEPVQVPNATAVPRAVVYGSLISLLPHYDVTPALQMFLYGPNDYGKAALRNPQGMTLLGNLLLVCDQGWPDVIAIDLAGGRRVPFTHPDHRPRCPVSVATDGACVYVGDTTMRSVLVYDLRGRLLEELAPSTDPARPFRPAAVFVHERVLYVGNPARRQVERFDLDGRTWLAPVGPAPDGDRLVAPVGLDVLPDGTLLIVDGVLAHVLRLKADGEWLTPIGRPGRRAGEFVRPKQVTHTASGLILVADAGRQSILVFDANGRHLMEVHETNGGWRGFTLPMGVAPLAVEQLGWITAGTGGLLPPADEYVLVTDELGYPSITLLGLVNRQDGEVADGR